MRINVRRGLGILVLLLTSCATQSSTPPVVLVEAAYLSALEQQQCAPVLVATASTASTDTATIAELLEVAAAALEEDAAEETLPAEEQREAESGEVDALRTVTTTVSPGLRYSADISDEDLFSRWTKDPSTLGSISMGFADEGRLINGAAFPRGEGVDWTVISPHKAFATANTVEQVLTAIKKVRELYPNAPALRVNNMSGPEGGYLRPHKSHQSGRDVDLAFYYPTADVIRTRARENVIDVALNWQLVRALVTLTDVEVIWVDYRVQKVLYDHALTIGEDRTWLDSLFNAGASSLIKHARRHRDHFHVRFYDGRAQELGRRIAPLLAQRQDQNLVMVRVKNGDTLGHIAARYNSGVSVIQKANRMRGSFLRVGQVLRVPLRGPCTRCPVPPAVHVPPRRLPPPEQQAAL
jgi:murein endopeptidase